MTYAVFLLLFLVLPIVVLLATLPRPLAGRGGWRGRLALPLVALLALLYTTPWDNYLVYRGVWYYGPDRVLATIGYVPVEEYAFFLLQPVLTGLVLYHLLARFPQPSHGPAKRFGGALVFGILTLEGIGLLLVGPPSGLYLGLILAWAAPVLLGMWLFAGPYVGRYRRVALLALAGPTLYLWIIDRLAIGLGIWDISNEFSFDLDPFGLPIEEAVFFLITNALVVIGTILFLFGDRIAQQRLVSQGGRQP